MFGNWGTTLLVADGVAATGATYALAAFWAAVTVGRLVIALVAERLGSTRIYVVVPWAVALALVLAPVPSSTAGGIGSVRLRRARLRRVLPDDGRLRRVDASHAWSN